MKKYLLTAIIFAVIFALGCAQEKPIGGERDEHGCLGPAGYTWCESKQKCLRTWEEECKVYCTNESRAIDGCPEIYQPVCGWPDESIKCIRFPCASEYPNNCFACKDPDVAYYTRGECPKDDPNKPPEERAVDIAMRYVMEMDEYRKENGRNIRKERLIQAECTGCWMVNLQFDLNSEIADKDRMTVRISIEEWSVVDIDSSRESINVLTPEECTANGGRAVNTVGGVTCEAYETNIADVKGFISPNICCVET